MSDNDKIDFSPLDPSRDALRWERMIKAVADRASHAHAVTFAMLLRSWAKPALALAASAALAVCSVAVVKRLQASQNFTSEPAYVLAAWATSDEAPSPSRIIEVFGGYHGD